MTGVSPGSWLFVIGLGPGDPELLTLKGLKYLQAASVVFVPRGRDGRGSLARQIAEPYLDRERQRVVELPLAMTRDAQLSGEAWRAAADLMALCIPSEGTAAYLLLGDPSLYGTFGCLAEGLRARRADVRIAIVPGIHSYSAAAALAQWPLASGRERVAIVPASYEQDPKAFLKLLKEFDTLILMKAAQALPRLSAVLRESGLAARVLVVERLGLPEQRVFHSLAEVDGITLHYLSLAIIRKV